MKAIALILCLIIASVHGFPKSLWPWNQENRIVGGVVANISEIPYQASVMLETWHACGGVILNKDYILTAGHCFDEIEHVDQVQVRVGSTNAYHGGITYDIEKYVVHENYDSKQVEYDVAIVKLAYSLRFDKNIQPAKLAEDGYEPKTNAKVTVSGWGRLNFNGTVPDLLHKVDLEVMDRDDCYIAHMEHADISERHICAGVTDYSKDSCSGDSGGPLTENGVVVGIVSWGIRCAYPEYPGVYTNIGYYRNWIDMNSKIN